ncbi:MAG TPA: efflux RND transporter periplasmic adaptor subunit [Thermoanaerobaculia bacterium]|jgi:HlyD family secretion protein
MKKWLLFGLVVLVIAAVVTVSLVTSKPKGAEVTTGRVGRGEVRAIVSGTGEIQARTKVDISSHVIARIEKLYVHEGDLVKRGDRLVDLDREQYLSQRDRSLATLAGAEAEVQRAAATLANSRIKRERARQLATQKIASREFLEAAELAYESASTALAAARERVRESKAAVETATGALSKTSIDAPMSGRVTRINAEEGETVVTGTMNMPGSVILTVSDLSHIEAKVEVDEAAVGRVRLGQKATVRVDSFPDRDFRGEVVEIADSAVKKQDVAYFLVKVRLLDTAGGLRPGMTARARIDAESRKGVLVVPIEAVVEKKDEKGEKAGSSSKQDAQKIVYRIEANRAKAAPVEVGLTDETRVEIVSGIKEGETIAIGPYRTLKALKDGSPVVESARKKG